MITKRRLATVLLNGNPVLYHEKDLSEQEIINWLKKAKNMIFSETQPRSGYALKKTIGKEISPRQECLAMQAVEMVRNGDYQLALHEIVDCISDYEDNKTYIGSCADSECTEISESEIAFFSFADNKRILPNGW